VALQMYTDDCGGIIPSATPRCPDRPLATQGPCYCEGSGVNDYHATFLGTIYDLNYCHNLNVMQCPSDALIAPGRYHGSYTFGLPEGANNTSYGYNHFGLIYYWYTGNPACTYAGVQAHFMRTTQIKNPAQTYWVADNSDATTGPSFPGNYFY